MSKEQPEKCCGNCKWFDIEPDMSSGLCFCGTPPMPTAANVEFEPMNPDEGTHCPCFKAKEKK